ncbi:hypothetical protein NEIG_01332 [Nematocida sp. ERTm5]|nr:hypothetical protein NEIG_01332 [Nematocida sp. ERTm5]
MVFIKRESRNNQKDLKKGDSTRIDRKNKNNQISQVPYKETKDCILYSKIKKEGSTLEEVSKSTISNDDIWSVLLNIGPVEVLCKLDSGADVNIMSSDVYQIIPKKYIIKETKKTEVALFTIQPGNPIVPERKVLVNISCYGICIGNHIFYVLSGKRNETLLSKNTMELLIKLGLLKIQFKGTTQIHENITNSSSYSFTESTSGIKELCVEYHKSKKTVGPSKKGKVAFIKNPPKKIKEILYDTPFNMSYLSTEEIKNILHSVATENLRNKITPINLETRPGNVPHVRRFISYKKFKIAEEKVQEFLKRGIIVPAEKNKWLSPVVLIKNSDDEWKFCLDLRKLNQLTQRNNAHIPNKTIMLDELRDMKYFTKLFIEDASFNIPLNEKDQDKTTFIVGSQYYKFTVVPMGYRNTANLIQMAIENMLGGGLFLEKCCLVYIDTVLIYSKDLASHKKDVTSVVNHLKKYGVELNIKKTVWATKEIELIWYKICHNKIKPIDSKLEYIQEYTEPRNKKELRRFIGALQQNQRFLYNISETLRPLYQLVKKEEPWKWMSIHKNAFTEAKGKLTAKTQLIIPDYTKRFTLEVNTNNTTIYAVLRQDSGVVGYYSKTLSKKHKKLTPAEKEVYAILWALNKKCDYYLNGIEFDLISDHREIECYHTLFDFVNSRMRLWYEILDDYSFIPNYRPSQTII